MLPKRGRKIQGRVCPAQQTLGTRAAKVSYEPNLVSRIFMLRALAALAFRRLQKNTAMRRVMRPFSPS